MNQPQFSGIYPAIVSPVGDDGKVLEVPLRKMVAHLAHTPIQGVYVGGGTGEGVLLPVSVRKRILEIVIDELSNMQQSRDRKLQVIAHIGAAEAQNTEDLAFHAATIGSDAISAIPPMYYQYGRQRICSYYRWISELADVPLIVYAAAQSSIQFSSDMVQELASYPLIKGLKFTGYNFFELLEISQIIPSDFSLLNGGDEVLLFGLLAGAHGGIGATYSVMPNRFCSLYQSYLSGDFEAAREQQIVINKVIRTLISHQVIDGVKCMLTHLGFPVGHSVFPNESLGDDQERKLLKDLEAIGWREICK